MSVTSSTQLVIFGLTGDLARRKLIPALYNLMADGLLSEKDQIVGISRRPVEVSEVLGFMTNNKAYRPEIVAKLVSATRMFQMNLIEPDDYKSLKNLLDEQEANANYCLNRLFYLSMPAQSVNPVIDYLGRGGLTSGCPHGSGESRLLVEKPFGYDLSSARELIAHIAGQFKEEQVFRIDHYLAKETSQNILTFRFSNQLFESIWNGRAVERIVITASEDIGIENRTIFYNQTGALRDLIQSHLLQLLALVAMEEPSTMDSRGIHEAKLRLLQSVVAPSPDEVAAMSVRGQYEGYSKEIGKATSTETFAALRLSINNERWAGVPIILQSGKALDTKRTEITLQFKDRTATPIDNRLTIYIQPDEGIGLGIMVKKPGLDNQIELADMSFRYSRSFKTRQPDAYERVLVDAIRGDRTLFATSEQVLEAWRIVEPVIQAWSRGGDGLEIYKPGTSADELTKKL